jgi:long-chain acyl-CoA synthetase
MTEHSATMFDRDLANVADNIARHAAERPWAVAIVDNSGVIHYRTLDALVWAAAWHLRNLGIKPGDVVGLALPHSALYAVAVYGLARLGAMVVALPLSDPPALRALLAKRLNVSWVLGISPGAAPPGIADIVFKVDDLRRAPATPPAELRAPGGETVWSIRRTSGTTGDPKAIGRTHRASFASYVMVAAYYPGPNHRSLAVIDLATAFGLSVAERTFYGGGALVIAPTVMNAADFLGMIDSQAITHVYLTANFLSALLPLLPADSCRCPGLLRLMVTGMAMPEALRAEIRRRFTPNLSVMYGSNEAYGVTMADPDVQEKFPETVGRIMPGAEVEIVDDQDRPLPAGEIGHIRARSPAAATSYVNADVGTSRTFRNGWVYLGDLGLLSAEGLLFLKGRIDDMMIYDGIKIWPTDIEEALRAHPAVMEAVAFPIASVHHQHVPVAAVILRQPVGAEELLEHCRKRLGQRAPHVIGIETSFPRNAAGKVLRTELANAMAGRMPPSLR